MTATASALPSAPTKTRSCTFASSMPLASGGNGHRQEESSAMLGDRERLAPEPFPPAPTSGAGGPTALRTTDRLVPLAAVVPPAKVDPLPVTTSLVKSSGSAE